MDKVRMDLGSGVCRQKYWEELTAEEKVEVLASNLEYLERENKRLSSIVYKTSDMAREHNHLDGKVVMSISRLGSDCEQGVPGSMRTLLNRQPK
jgi:hypothetical protein